MLKVVGHYYAHHGVVFRGPSGLLARLEVDHDVGLLEDYG